MNFYIADTHFGHRNAMERDHRPFSSLEEMEQTIVKNWNQRVTDTDTVYILGDFCWSRQEEEWIRILRSLKGEKCLLLGGLDVFLREHISSKLRNELAWFGDYLEVSDGNKKVVLCHYPLIFYRFDYTSSFVMLHGKTHDGEAEHMLDGIKEKLRDQSDISWGKGKGLIYNCGVMKSYMDYTPRTLGEILRVNNASIYEGEKEV